MKKFFKKLDRIATQIPVSEVMVRDIKTVDEEDTVQTAIDLMAKHSISGLIICHLNFPVGIISEGDIIKSVLYKRKDPKKLKVKSVMSKKVFTIGPNLSIGEASTLMKKHGFSKLPVTKNNVVIGVVTKHDLLEKLNEIYYQNRRLVWLTALTVIQFIVIAILLIYVFSEVNL